MEPHGTAEAKGDQAAKPGCWCPETATGAPAPAGLCNHAGMQALAVCVGLLLVSGWLAAAQQDATATLSAMRTALGSASLGVRSLSATGSVTRTRAQFRKSLSVELSFLFPEHYLRVERDFDSSGFRPIDITYFRGFARDALIRRTDANIPFPPDPGPSTAEAIAQRDAGLLVRNRREFTQFALALFGRSFDAYPLRFVDAGTDTWRGRPMNVVEAQAADGFVTRIYVDAATHLPAVLAWQAPPEVVVTGTMTSTVTTQGGQVISQSPPAASPVPVAPTPSGTILWRLELSDFKSQDGVNWPHRFKIFAADREQDDLRLGRYRINPKMDESRFAIR
jgi:hypothetical protein